MARSRRDVWPDDVRKDLTKYSSTIVAWTGVVAERKLSPDGKVLRIVIDHHYWDWVEDFGQQREHVFLSPRGEGRFGIAARLDDVSGGNRFLPVGSMSIVFGTPTEVTPEHLVVLDFKWSITIEKPWFATDFWDYGRAYLEHGDKSDLKVLRTF